MKLLVTGGSGLLGTAIRSAWAGSYEILLPTRSELDLEDSEQTMRYILKNLPDYCIHAAANVFGLAGHKLNPSQALLVNSRIDINLISALHKAPPKSFLYVGTVAAYGYPYRTERLNESDFLLGLPHSGEYGYAMAKRFGLDLSNSLKELGVKVTYAIMTNLFGPNDNFNETSGHVVPSLISRAVRARDEKRVLEVWGRKTDTRDFMYSGTAASILLRLIETNFEGRVNVGSGFERSIESVVEIICDELKISSVNYNENVLNSIRHRVLDTKFLAETIGQVDDQFEKNLRSTINWYLENSHSARS
jgi:GDP-L-fucose synthase